MNTNNEPTLENVNLDFLNKKAIHSFTPFTLLDYPDKSACILWFAGCNMKCDYCYNPEIVFGKGTFYFSEIISFLKSRSNLLDAVVFSGGECLIHKDIITFIKLVKNLGFLIKVDTNGSQPKVLEKLIKEKLIDYVALDFKGPKEKFFAITKLSTNIALYLSKLSFGCALTKRFRMASFFERSMKIFKESRLAL